MSKSKASGKASMAHRSSDVYCDFSCALSVRKVRSRSKAKTKINTSQRGKRNGGENE